MKRAFFAVSAVLFFAASARAETLYNGITLQDPWPPVVKFEDMQVHKVPAAPFYLKNLPAVIPIDVGRQLFVDTFLIESTTLKEDMHLADEYPGNPIQRGMPGAIWWDPSYKAFRLWHSFYGDRHSISTDGVHFSKAPQGVKKPPAGDNGGGNLGPPWLDLDAKDPNKRFVSIFPICFRPAGRCEYWIRFSPDGLNWSDAIETDSDCGDASKFFYNPFRGVWVFSARHGWGKPRARRYWECRDLEKGPYKPAGGKGICIPIWVGADTLDPQREDMNIPCQIYNMDTVAYESLMVGGFSIWRGDPEGRSKFKDVCIGFSRDGWSWSRPDRRPHAPISEQVGEWNFINVDTVTGVAYAVMGDRLFFYVSGRGMLPQLAMYTLRRDGWISMDAGAAGGELVTRPVKFSGKHFFVNVDAAGGELRVEALDEKDNAVAPFTKENCRPVSVNKTLQPVTWAGAADLSALAGKNVKFRFHLKNGKLYSFWVSPDASGASNGYVGVGGPGYTGSRDTVGVAAYEAVTPSPKAGEAPAPMLWPLSGSYNGRAEISMSFPLHTAVPGLEIRYTTDGAEPTEASPVFEKPVELLGANGPLPVDVQAISPRPYMVKARAFKAGLKPSAVVTEEYKLIRDETPPLRYYGAPDDAVAEGAKSVTLSLRTNEKAECKYSDKPGVPFRNMTQRMTTQDGFLHKIEIKDPKPGAVYAYFVKAVDQYGNLNADDYNLAVHVPASGDGTPRYKVKSVNLESGEKTLEHVGPWETFKLDLEAKAAELAAPMVVAAEVGASGGKAVTSAESGKGTATIKFAVPASGVYIVWLRAKGAKGDMQDSFFASMDSGREDVADIKGAQGKFGWVPVDGRDSIGEKTLCPRRFVLEKGEHKLTVRCRKPGMLLDAIIVTNDQLFEKKE
jgi:hypothetical protein